MLYVELLQVSVEVQYTIKEKLLTHIWHRITEKISLCQTDLIQQICT